MRARLYVLGALATLVAMLMLTPATMAAYHETGSLVCGNCHIMHKTDGSAGAVTVGDHLLESGSTSCLKCHDESNAYVEPTDTPWVLDSAGSIGAGALTR